MGLIDTGVEDGYEQSHRNARGVSSCSNAINGAVQAWERNKKLKLNGASIAISGGHVSFLNGNGHTISTMSASRGRAKTQHNPLCMVRGVLHDNIWLKMHCVDGYDRQHKSAVISK
eukprot:4642266-Amphidinium_carterae.1